MSLELSVLRLPYDLEIYFNPRKNDANSPVDIFRNLNLTANMAQHHFPFLKHIVQYSFFFYFIIKISKRLSHDWVNGGNSCI